MSKTNNAETYSNHENSGSLFCVAVGASAGGLEALSEFVSALPKDAPMAYMIVQHLSPDFDSLMDQLLQRRTDLKICTVTDGTKVEVNTIFLMPPKTNMLMAEGKLILVDQVPHQGSNFPIDVFFRSVAADSRHRSVAVILSGTGSDGSRGIKDVKEAGGLTIVQDPEEAQFDGMPVSAIQTQLVDAIMPAAEIPQYLLKVLDLGKSPKKSGEPILDKADDTVLANIYAHLLERHDIDFSLYKPNTVKRRIERRMRMHDIEELTDYAKLLLAQPKEASTLTKEMLIGVTHFFRDIEAFDCLQHHVIPKIFDNTPSNEMIRVWTAGCSSGEEAYSIAMLFDEERQRRKSGHEIKIFASDVDANAIKEASVGAFSINIATDVNAERLDRYFVKTEEGFTVSSELRHLVVFANHNLLKDPPFSNCQLVVCRNLMIYFQAKAQQNVLSMMQFSLRKDGYLFLGSSETLGDFQKNFKPINERYRIYQKDQIIHRINDLFTLPANRNNRERKNSPSIERILDHYQQPKERSHMPALEALVNDFIPACVIMSEQLEVIHLYGDLQPYTKPLQQGRFSAKIGDYLIEGLTMAVTTAIHKVVKLKEAVRFKDIQYHAHDGSEANVDLVALYIPGSKSNNAYVALGLSPASAATRVEPRSVPYDGKLEPQQRINDLEEALRHNQYHLSATIEELETTNEELQSTNEELMASNEELQSTNEELQSVNEELYSVNSEYQEQIEETTKVNLDIENIIKSADIGFIFLDDAMVIRRFSPKSTQHINLIESDVGRPFHHISHNLKYDDLLKEISSVINEEVTIEKEVSTKEDSQLLIKLAPYMDKTQKAQGCVISLTDISQIQLLKTNLASSYAELKDIMSINFTSNEELVEVLVVDDNEVDLLAIKTALNSINRKKQVYRVHTVGSFDQAKAFLQKQHVDLCLLDYYLGAHNGLELVRDLSDGEHNPAFILFSGEVDNELTESAVQLGIYDVIDKGSITPALLERIIRYSLRHKKTDMYLSKLV
ncbi:MAG: histidine kinase [Alteromonadaceae bacterium]|uniref:chemotaxis protein CheB n=1 Tax=Paraglaciecola chathamensis TaxID=368405 RepID=UPI000C69C0A5|nr:chemotaxis protein CheB [Paraglaciecola agarilytica]MBN25574.1 histidine kinase [Alteromonadaceae bacterium]|tara:strand:+ start:112055 stop:115084 length:3030 start_codon:yes stop_codon:yes gene_type:complete